VSYRYVALEGPQRFPGHCQGKLLDISMGGAQVEGPLPPEVDGKELTRLSASGEVTVSAVFDLPFVERALEVEAKVSWVKPPSGASGTSHPHSYIGLRFLSMTEDRKRIIRAFLIGLQSPSRKRFRGRR
jgi:hypothetical protein